MNNIHAHHKLIYGYYRKATNFQFINTLTMIILEYMIIPEHLHNYGDRLTRHEDDYTITYDMTDDLISSDNKIQTAYGWVEMWPDSIDAEWKFEYALPQQRTSFYIGITNVTQFKNTHPSCHRFRKDDTYLGFEIIPNILSSRFNRFEIKQSDDDEYGWGGYNVIGSYMVDTTRMVYGEGCFRVKSRSIMDLYHFTNMMDVDADQGFIIEASVELVGLSLDWDNERRKKENTDRRINKKPFYKGSSGMRLLLSVSVPMGGSFRLMDYNFGDFSLNALYY